MFHVVNIYLLATRWVSSALNDEPVIVTQAANNLLSVKTNRSADKINAAEALEFVVEKTGTLEVVLLFDR